MAKAIGYIRVSTTQQAEEGVSLEAQQARIAAYCLANDLDLVDVYVDAGISGKRADNRPALQSALTAACQHKAALVVYSLSRLARSIEDTISIAKRLERASADLVSLTEKIDTTTAAGKMIFRMLAVLAEFERDLVSDRTKVAMSHKKAQSQRVGSIPFGYELAADGSTLIANHVEQDIIAAIHDLRTQGLSLKAIAQHLTDSGIPTKKGNATWTHTAIARILARAA